MHNEPAFPTKEPMSSDYLGISKQEYYAAQAMYIAVTCLPRDTSMSDRAKWCHEYAKAMIEEYNKQ